MVSNPIKAVSSCLLIYPFAIGFSRSASILLHTYLSDGGGLSVDDEVSSNPTDALVEFKGEMALVGVEGD
jgi:hypothetical protein